MPKKYDFWPPVKRTAFLKKVFMGLVVVTDIKRASQRKIDNKVSCVTFAAVLDSPVTLIDRGSRVNHERVILSAKLKNKQGLILITSSLQSEPTLVVLKVALGYPLPLFDYLAPPDVQIENIEIGMRVCVPFGKKEVIGIVLEKGLSNLKVSKLKHAINLPDLFPLFSEEMIAWLKGALLVNQNMAGAIHRL